MSTGSQSLGRLLDALDAIGRRDLAEAIRAEVRALRAEAADYRTRLRGLERALAIEHRTTTTEEDR